MINWRLQLPLFMMIPLWIVGVYGSPLFSVNTHGDCDAVGHSDRFK